MSMTLKEAEAKVRALEVEILKLEDMADDDLDLTQSRQALEKKRQELLEEAYKHLSAYDHVYLARKANRPNIHEYIDSLFDNFMEMHGDRLYGDDGAVYGAGMYSDDGDPDSDTGYERIYPSGRCAGDSFGNLSWTGPGAPGRRNRFRAGGFPGRISSVRAGHLSD